MTNHDEAFLKRAAAAKQRIRQISPEQARTRIAEGVTVLDVRSTEEFAEGHIAGAHHLPVDLLAEASVVLPADKQTPIICYCRGGNRGALAADALQQLGYRNVASIEGGLSAFLDKA